MDMRAYRVIGDATYIRRDGTYINVAINCVIESPDDDTAPVLALAEFEVSKGAGAMYDPQARWREPWHVRVEDETAKREAIAATGLTIGCMVKRRRGGGPVGIVRHVAAGERGGKLVVRVAVDWPAPNRINGDGWHRSELTASAIERVPQ